MGDLDRWSTYLVPLVGGGGTVPYLGIITWANDKKNGAYGPVDKALQFKLRYVKSDLFELRIKM